MHLGHFSASVYVDGAKLSEYAVELSADGTQATCWIPSEDDKKFCVKLINSEARSDYDVSGNISADGINCGGKTLRPERHGRFPSVSLASRDSVAVSANTRRPLTFSKQALTDDDAYLNAAISPDLGTIKVEFVHVRRKLGRTSSKRWAGPKRFEPQIFHERSKKAMGHSVQFGQEFNSGLNKHRPTEFLEKLGTLTFKYRPIELLRAEGIAPPAPKRQRAATPEDVLDLTMDVATDEDGDDDEAKIRKLEAQLGALKNKKRRVKCEPHEVKKEIKSERPIFKSGEVIDLT
ncbi:hypothetical protein B0H15DRAFT_449787 [Mycena belliarum]|uniref:DUF7918 domain-containing protein n=1 Tax=Mycena belliarum TaxID=1033014 RepID=A0AAD6TXP0_9AGAR|nr:hypothetical protein B0H15DRAFT_449787 [Mycena belliae]